MDEYDIDHHYDAEMCPLFYDECTCKEHHYDQLYLYYMQDGTEYLLAKEGAD